MLPALFWALLVIAVFALLNRAWVRLFVRVDMRRQSVGHAKVISIATQRPRKRPAPTSFAK